MTNMDSSIFFIVFLLTFSGGSLAQGPAKRVRIVTSILEPPFLMYNSRSDKPLIGNDRYEGYIKDLLDSVAKKVGFDYQISLVKDGRYGSINTNGEWNGMIGELIRQEADLAAAGLLVSAMRMRVVDFSQPFMVTGAGVVMNRKDVFVTVKPQLSFLGAFKPEVWVSVVVAFIMVVLGLFLIRRFNPYEKEETSDRDRVISSLWMVCGGLLLQGFDKRLKSLASFFLLGGWWLFSILLLATFLVAIINIKLNKPDNRKIPRIQSLEDLTQTPDIQMGAISGGSTLSFFCFSKIRLYHHVCRRLRESSTRTTTEGLERVKKGRYAFMTDSASLNYAIARDCDLVRVGGLMNRKYMGLATPLGSDLRERVNLAILELEEAGVLEMLYTKWWYSGDVCDREKSVSNNMGGMAVLPAAVKIQDLSSLFICLLVGIGLTVVAMVIEVVCFRVKTKKSEDMEKRQEELTGDRKA